MITYPAFFYTERQMKSDGRPLKEYSQYKTYRPNFVSDYPAQLSGVLNLISNLAWCEDIR